MERTVKNMPTIDYSIYLVTDDGCLHGRDLLQCVDAALRGGVTLVQYRSKHADGGKMYRQSLALKALCDKYNVPLIINDRLDIAMAVGAAGVHVGQDDIPCGVVRQILGDGYVIGVSAHNVTEAVQAASDGTDYLGCGAVFGSVTKSDVTNLGLSNLAAIRKAVQLPMVGIGGVNAENYASVLETGAEGAAIVSAILGASDIEAAVRQFAAVRNSFTKK